MFCTASPLGLQKSKSSYFNVRLLSVPFEACVGGLDVCSCLNCHGYHRHDIRQFGQVEDSTYLVCGLGLRTLGGKVWTPVPCTCPAWGVHVISLRSVHRCARSVGRETSSFSI